MHPKKALGPLLCLSIAAGVSTAAVAHDGAELYQIKTCISCHGKDAKTPILPAYPKIAGQNAEYLFQQLKDIRSGTRSNSMTPAMHGIMQNVNEEEMRILADWIASLAYN